MEPNPFAYSNTAHVRKHGPYGYRRYQHYREWLRDEFSFRCVFCLYREQWPSPQTWEIEHLIPRSKAPEKDCHYRNLLYVCRSCNANKRLTVVPDPCVTAFGDCLRVHSDGSIVALNGEGRLIIANLRLDNTRYTRMRRLMLGILRSLLIADPRQLREMMSYPQNLPDLENMKPEPKGNTKPDGLKNTFYALRARGELPETY